MYSDEAAGYAGLPRDHETVKYSVSEYVREQAHMNGVESFWAMLQRAHIGTYYKVSPKHLDRYVQEFAGKKNFRESDTLDQMRATVLGLVGHSLPYRRLVRDNGPLRGAVVAAQHGATGRGPRSRGSLPRGRASGPASVYVVWLTPHGARWGEPVS